MFQWYANAKTCYAYLHGLDDSFIPTEKDDEKYRKSNGWPEWFSRGWTLQEMIAPRNLQFFNKDCQSIGNKEAHAWTLHRITGVPGHILANGLEGNRPCVAQIISWAANRTTTRMEDRAYSLILVFKYGCSSVAFLTPTPSSEPICHSGIMNLETYCLLIWCYGIPITIGIRQRALLALRIPLQIRRGQLGLQVW